MSHANREPNYDAGYLDGYEKAMAKMHARLKAKQERRTREYMTPTRRWYLREEKLLAKLREAVS